VSSSKSATNNFLRVTARLALAGMLCILGSYATASSAPASPSSTISMASPSSTISIVASNWKFTPGTITVKVGRPTTFELRAAEGVHGIQSSDLGIPDTTILPGKTVSVTFTPTKVGTFAVHCAVFCGAGHANMTLTVKVVS
jgi:cytochrome c oxidase subunit 2